MPPDDRFPGDAFGVRVAGMPADGFDRLRCAQSWTLAGELINRSAWLAAEGEALSDLLYELIGRNTRPELKPLLVGLRRAVYACRRPDRTEQVLDDLPADVAARLVTWLHRLRQREELRQQIPQVLAGELAETSGALRELAADPGFRSGLAHSSGALSAELDKWIAEPQSAPRRQVLARLARYVARATVKTSPYATFTVSGLGRWSDGGPAVQTPPRLGGLAVVPELDLRTVWRLWDAIVRRPDGRVCATVRINPTLTEHDGRLRFLAAGPGEPLSSIPATPAVRDVLARLADGNDTKLGAVRDATGETALIDQLAEIGALELRRPFADQAADPLGDLLAWTERELPAESADRSWLPAGLGALHQAATLPAGQAPDTKHLARIGELADTLLARLGDAASPAATHPPCLHTAVSADNLAVCARPAWRPVLDDLQVLRRFLGALDADLPVKLTAADLFTATYGPRETVHLLDFYRLAHGGPNELRALLHRQYVPGDARVRELRRQARQTLADGAAAADGTVTADPGLIGKLVSSWPGYVRPPGSICCFGQALPGTGLVLNAVYSGYGRHTGRIRHLLGRASTATVDTGTPPVARYPVTGTNGTFGTCLNLRPPTATDAIDYPFTIGPAGLSLTQLRVRHDDRTGRLVLLDPDGRGLLPAHLGMSNELMLPPAWSFLIRVFGEPPLALPPGWPPWAGDAGAVRRQPRLALGSVVVARARWHLRAAEFPAPGKGEADAAYLIRVASWLRRHEIPSRFFARSSGRWGGKSRKPLYVDAASYFMLTSFARALPEPDDAVLLEEVLPDPADAPRYGEDGQRVTEYVFEISADPA